VAGDSVPELLFGPASISIHNDGDVAGKVFFIDFFHNGEVVLKTETSVFFMQASSDQLSF
jgi:hypothetical protein